MNDDSPHFQFDAYGAYRHLKDRYADFLLDTFHVRPGPLADRLRHHWQASDGGFCLFRPLLVQGAFPFAPGSSISELQSSAAHQEPDRPLHPRTVEMLQRAHFPTALYEHQVKAVRAGSAGRTVVLSAGTGSGKTEAFLIPLVDALHWAQERGEDDLTRPGVRAIVVYPLNALVNNQVERLRKLLCGQSDITFAYYTSRLHDEFREARRYYEARGKGEPPACQIVDRRTLRGLDTPPGRPSGPPHILVTNFSMLEYMLIRPLDRTLFLNGHLFHNGRPRLRAVVLDEAHVYAGAQAAEIHMLLRRAAQRFGTTLESLQGFATSATLSRGGDERAEIDALARFATGMFSKPAAQVTAIVGRRYLPAEEAPARTDARPLRVPDSTYVVLPPGLRTLEYDAEGNPIKLVQDRTMAEACAKACQTLGVADEAAVESLPAARRDVPALLLHALMSSHPRIAEVRAWLFGVEKHGLPTLDEVAQKLFGAVPGDAERRATDAILRLASLARLEADRLPLIPARMHAFLRAPAGVWVSARTAHAAASGDPILCDDTTFEWAAISSTPPSGAPEEPPALQLFTCSSCGHPYFEGWAGTGDDGAGIVAGRQPEGTSSPSVAFVCDSRGDHVWPGGMGPRLRRVDVVTRAKSARGTAFETVERGRVTCQRCEDDQARLWPLALGPRSALGAIVDAVYPYLNEHPNRVRERLPGAGRRLLTFSDSRQQAARTAADVENSHDIGVNRRLLVDVLAPPGTSISIQELADRVYRRDRQLRERAAARGADREILEELKWVCVYQELARPPARGNTVETLGLIEVVYPSLPSRPAAVSGLTDDEWRDLLSTVLDDARRRGAVKALSLGARAREQYNLHELLPAGYLDKTLVFATKTPTPLDGDDEEAADDGKIIGLAGASGKAGDLRLRLARYVRSVCDTMGPGAPSAVELLREIWDALWRGADGGSCRWLKTVSDDQHDQALRLDLRFLEVRRHEAPLFMEPASGRVYFRSVRDISPERATTGRLHSLTDEDRREWRASHPIRRILDEPLLGLHTAEHTAQIDVESLEAQETEFREGKVNLLASSTTMEMGIDLGGLTFVVLTNAPPGPANYWQRAGRAGRRADGSSAVLTLTLPRPHDQKVFADPRAFLAQEVVPPRVRLDAEPLVLRHANAFLLTAFFEDALTQGAGGDPMRAFGTVGELIFTSARKGRGMRPELADALGVDDEQPLCDAFLSWLGALDSISTLAPRLQTLLGGTALFGWTVAEVARASAEAFEKAVRRARQDLDSLRSQRREEHEKGEASRDQSYLRSLDHQENDLKHETTISYLARADYLPRFGFPVGLVYLDTRWQSRKDGGDRKARGEQEEAPAWPELRMERALDLSLSEYVPGAEVIAGKRIHRSAGLIRNWMSADDDGAMKRRFVLECLQCGMVDDRAADLDECPVCGAAAQSEEAFRKSEVDAGKQDKRRKKRGDDGGDRGTGAVVSPVRTYWMPSSFAVQFGRPPRRVAGVPDRLPGARVRLALSADDAVREVIPGLLAAGFAPESRLFVRSEGYLRRGGASGFGYAICRVCGRAEPEEGFGAPPAAMKQHYRLRGGGRCPARPEKNYSRNAVLGTSATVDALRIRLLGDMAPAGLPDQEAFYLTLAICIQQIAADHLGVDRRVIKSTVGTYRGPDGAYGREAVLYDESGSGMLAHVADDAVGVVRGAVELALRHEESDFIRFDTQFLAVQGKLRLNLVRSHFEDEARLAQLREPESLKEHGARALRNRGPRTAVIGMLQDPGAEVLLVAPNLSSDAFHKDGVLRAVQRAAVDGGERIRLLLGRPPSLSGTANEALLAGQIGALIRAGVAVRVAALNEVPVWRALARRRGAIEAVGALDAHGTSLVASQGEDFGPGWLEKSIPVELAEGADGQDILSTLHSVWANARVVQAAELEAPRDDTVRFFPIRHGATDAASTDLRALMEKCLGPMGDIGEVEAIGYVDRYVLRSLVAMYRLRELFDLFQYARGVRGFVLSEGPSREPYPSTSAADLLRSPRLPKNLSEPESGQMEAWVKSSLQSKVTVDFKRPAPLDRIYLRHPRKLLVRFSPGGRLQTLKIVFEHGLDWVRPANGPGPWTHRPLIADESHVVVITDHRLEDECDTRGESEWTRYIGK